MVPGWFFIVFHGSRLFLHGSRSVFTDFHGSRSVFMDFHGSRLVFHGFHGSRLVFHGFHGSRLVFHGFSWFQVGFSWFFAKMYWPELYPGPMIQSRSAAQRAAWDLVWRNGSFQAKPQIILRVLLDNHLVHHHCLLRLHQRRRSGLQEEEEEGCPCWRPRHFGSQRCHQDSKGWGEVRFAQWP